MSQHNGQNQNDVLLEVKNLHTYFFLDEGTARAVNGVTFEVPRGKTLGVLGESGCGKSVTGFSILRLIQPPGRIVDGEILYRRMLPDQKSEEIIDLTKLKPHSNEMRQIRGGEIGVVFQEPMTSLDPVYTVGNQMMEAITLHQQVSEREARELAVTMLRNVGLPHPRQLVDSYPHQLSGGMRQRAMIAIALSCRPVLLIADEPTTALDVTTEAQILELMTRLQEDLDMAIMFITHNLGVIAEMAQEVIVMYMGKVVERADVRSIFYDPKHPYTQALLRSIPKLGSKSRERRTRLEAIEGMVPDPYNIPRGCPFHTRCPSFMPGVCDENKPVLTDIGAGHMVSCFLYDIKAEPEPQKVA